MLRRTLLALPLLLSAACAPSLVDEYPFDGALPPGIYATFTSAGGDTYTVNVEATAKESWVYVDMEGQQDVPASEAVGTDRWHLAFQRFKIISNSGVSGKGTVETVALPGQDFEALSQAPAEGYVIDRADGPDGNSDVDSAFLEGDGWYLYDLSQHKVTPRDITYVLHLPGGYFKMRLDNYYARAGTAGTVQFRWAKILPPPT